MKLKQLLTFALAGTLLAGTIFSASAAELDYKWYAEQNPDVVAAVGDSPEALKLHYDMYGRKEARMANTKDVEAQLRRLFDVEEYAKLYPDVKDFYGDDAEAMFMHYISYGMLEARRPSEKVSQAAANSLKAAVEKVLTDAGVEAVPGSLELVAVITGEKETLVAAKPELALDTAKFEEVTKALEQVTEVVEKAVTATVKEATDPAPAPSSGGNSSLTITACLYAWKSGVGTVLITVENAMDYLEWNADRSRLNAKDGYVIYKAAARPEKVAVDDVASAVDYGLDSVGMKPEAFAAGVCYRSAAVALSTDMLEESSFGVFRFKDFGSYFTEDGRYVTSEILRSSYVDVGAVEFSFVAETDRLYVSGNGVAEGDCGIHSDFTRLGKYLSVSVEHGVTVSGNGVEIYIVSGNDRGDRIFEVERYVTAKHKSFSAKPDKEVYEIKRVENAASFVKNVNGTLKLIDTDKKVYVGITEGNYIEEIPEAELGTYFETGRLSWNSDGKYWLFTMKDGVYIAINSVDEYFEVQSDGKVTAKQSGVLYKIPIEKEKIDNVSDYVK